jgi:hypothetical protein
VPTPDRNLPPDAKDWTWVLDRPCDECGFDASSIGRADIAPMIRRDAEEWTAELARPRVEVRTRDDRWSVLEYGCHVRDVYELYDTRLALMLDVDDPVFENWDQDATAIEREYGRADAREVSQALLARAHDLAARFDGIDRADWTRPGSRSDGARFTVESFGTYLVHDPAHHLWDVRQL